MYVYIYIYNGDLPIFSPTTILEHQSSLLFVYMHILKFKACFEIQYFCRRPSPPAYWSCGRRTPQEGGEGDAD